MQLKDLSTLLSILRWHYCCIFLYTTAMGTQNICLLSLTRNAAHMYIRLALKELTLPVILIQSNLHISCSLFIQWLTLEY